MEPRQRGVVRGERDPLKKRRVGERTRRRLGGSVEGQRFGLIGIDDARRRILDHPRDGFGVDPARRAVDPNVLPRYAVSVGVAYRNRLQGDYEREPQRESRRRGACDGKNGRRASAKSEQTPAAAPSKQEFVRSENGGDEKRKVHRKQMPRLNSVPRAARRQRNEVEQDVRQSESTEHEQPAASIPNCASPVSANE